MTAHRVWGYCSPWRFISTQQIECKQRANSFSLRILHLWNSLMSTGHQMRQLIKYGNYARPTGHVPFCPGTVCTDCQGAVPDASLVPAPRKKGAGALRTRIFIPTSADTFPGEISPCGGRKACWPPQSNFTFLLKWHMYLFSQEDAKVWERMPLCTCTSTCTSTCVSSCRQGLSSWVK